MANLKWCGYCDKEVKPTGKRNNLCPHCKRFVSKTKPEPKTKTSEFEQGFSGTQQPEESLTYKHLRQAGVVTSEEDVYKAGLDVLQARYLPQGQPPNQAKTHPEDKWDEKLDAMEDLSMREAIREARMKQFQAMRNPQSKGGNGTGMDMSKMMEYMFLEKMMDKGQNSSPELEIMKAQLAQKDREMENWRHQQQMQQLVEQIKSTGMSERGVAEKISELQRNHESRLERLRQESQNLRDEKHQVLMQNLMDQVQKRSSAEGWTHKFENIFMEKAINALSTQMEKGFNASESDKSTGQVITDVISRTATALAPAINAYAQRAQAQPMQRPQPKPSGASARITGVEKPTIQPTQFPQRSFSQDPLQGGGNVISQSLNRPTTFGLENSSNQNHQDPHQKEYYDDPNDPDYNDQDPDDQQ